MNNSKLTTSRITKATKQEAPKNAIDFASDQRKGVTNSQAPGIRSNNGTIKSNGGRFGGFLKNR